MPAPRGSDSAVWEEAQALEYLATARRSGGFLTEHAVEALATLEATRLTPVLVRCGGGRFTCAMQDVAHFIALVESGTHEGHRDYVRDVSLPAEPRS
jgi:hypothetical protein